MNRRKFLTYLGIGAAAIPLAGCAAPACAKPFIDPNGNPVAKLIVRGAPIPVIDSPYGRVMGWYEQPDGTFNVQIAIAPNHTFEINCDERQLYQMQLGDIVKWQCEMKGHVTMRRWQPEWGPQPDGR